MTTAVTPMERTTEPGARTYAQLREHYELEKTLADRLRRAGKAERRSLYSAVYDERAQKIPHHPLVVRAADPAAQARAIAPQVRMLRAFVTSQTELLEIGPGDCALAAAMAHHVKRVYAIDVSHELVKRLAPPPNFEFRLFSGIEIPLPPASVDFVFSNDVLEHLHPEDAHDQLVSVLRVLRPGGKYLCVTPNRLSGPHDVSRSFDRVATGFHLKEYTVGELADTLRAAGFRTASSFISVHGHILSPQLPVMPFRLTEQLLAMLPFALRRRAARGLTAVKVIAVK